MTTLTEGIHLYAFVKDEDGRPQMLEDHDYPDKQSYRRDLKANGYTVKSISDNRDIYIMDHSNYHNMNDIKNKLKFYKDMQKDSSNPSSWDRDVKELEDLISEANKISLTENKELDESKQDLFNQIKSINPNARWDFYKNKTESQILSILTSMQNHPEKYKQNDKSKTITKQYIRPDRVSKDYTDNMEELEDIDNEQHKSFDIQEREEKDENKLIESSSKITLYHNTSNENAIKINTEGIKCGLRKDIYGKGSEAEGSGIWCSIVRGYGYGGATITFEIDEKDESLTKQNDTEYIVYRDISPNEITDIDLVVSMLAINKLPRTVESTIPLALDKYGKEKLLQVFKKYEHNFVEPYNYDKFVQLVETGNKLLKGNISLTENKRITESNHKLEEVSRNELLAKTKGETISRYKRAEQYKGFSIVSIDTSDILKGNTLIVTCKVGKYRDTVQMEDILYWIQICAEQQTAYNKSCQITTKVITRAIQNAVDGMDIKVDCECGDFCYRFAYEATVWGYKYGKPENRPANITNPDGFGALCKHLTAMLSNKKWMQQITSTVMDWCVQNIDKINEFLKPKEGMELTLPNELARNNAKAGFYTKLFKDKTDDKEEAEQEEIDNFVDVDTDDDMEELEDIDNEENK